jgi:4-amino-4-deoxy-L-arabinose transferase-like glycosyltransferase
MDGIELRENEEWAILGDESVVAFRSFWNNYQVLLIVIGALCARLVLAAIVFRAQTNPSDHFAQFGWEMGWVARSIAMGHGFSSPFYPATGPTALVPPLFPYLLAAIFHVFGIYSAKSALAILSINSFLSALTCIPIYFSAKYSLGRRAAVVAGWAWAFFPFAIYFSGARVWDYALTSLLFTTCFCIAQRLPERNRLLAWLGFGMIYGLTALSNPSVITMFPVFLLLAVLEVRRGGGRWFVHSLVAVLGAIAVLTPWTVRNYQALHVIRPVRDNFWLECWAGNNGDTFESNPGWTHPASNPAEMRKFETAGEIAYLAEKQGLAMNFIREHPVFFVKVSLRRALCYWTGYWSLDSAYVQKESFEIPEVFFCTGLTLLMLLGAGSLWRWDRSAALPYVMLMAIFPVTYYFTHSSPDYRQPIEPEIIVLVVAGILSLREIARARIEAKAAEEEQGELVTSTSN